MKAQFEWDCPKCGLVHMSMDTEELTDKIKCPICGTARNQKVPSLCVERMEKCVECDGCQADYHQAI